MKKLIFVFLLLAITLTTNAQRKNQVIKWFSIAAKGGIGSSFLINSDMLNDDMISQDAFKLGYMFGARLTYSYGESLGFGVEYSVTKLNQGIGITSLSDTYTKTVSLTAGEVIPFFRYTGLSGGYFEIGPKFSTTKKVEETNTIESPNFTVYPDLAANYSSKFTSIMLGFGFAAVKAERLDLNFGLRAAYTFSSITADTYYIPNDGVYAPAFTFPTASTNPVSLQLLVELNYYFAFYGNASCGRGRLMFFR